jgi:hypothetical protein
VNASGDPLLRSVTTGDTAAVRDLTRAAHAPWAALIGREPLPMTFDHGAMIHALEPRPAP